MAVTCGTCGGELPSASSLCDVCLPHGIPDLGASLDTLLKSIARPPSALSNCPFCGGDESEDNAVQSAKLYMNRFRGAHGGMCIRVACHCGALGKGFDLSMPNAREAEAKAVRWWNARKE